MSDLIEITRLAKETVGSLLGRKRVRAENSWDEVVLALDKLNELSNHHVKAVAEVTAPLVTEGNLVETSHRYTALVNNPDFPQGYDEIRGILAATRNLPAFRDGAIQEKVRDVVDMLTRFQYGVFTLSWDSYHVADAISHAARVVSAQDPSEDDIARASQPFIQTFVGLFASDAEGSFKNTPTSTESLISLVQRWAQSWQRYVQQTLYGSKGLSSAIAQLKMQRHR